MELPSKILETIAYNTKPKIEEHMLIVMDKSIHEENLSQRLQANNKQFKIAITFLTGYNGIFNNTYKNNIFYFLTPASMLYHIIISPGVYELESLNEEIKRIIIEEGFATEVIYPFLIKPNFSTLGSITEITSSYLIDFTHLLKKKQFMIFWGLYLQY